MADYLNWYRGQKVVCVDDVPGAYENGTFHVVPLRAGEIYIIRQAALVEFYEGLEVGVWVCGVYRPKPDGSTGDYPFGASRFRPVEPKAMELFRKIAANPKQKVSA